MTTLRWVVVGFGEFGSRHATVLAELGQEIVAIVEPDSSRRARATAFAPDATVTADLADALDLAPDAVVVATPENLHLDPVVRSLAGAHVLVEKPIATDLAAASAMTAAQDSGRLLFVGHLLRFDPRLVALRSLIADGVLGEVVHLNCRRVGLRSIAHVYQRVEPLILSGVHDADIVAWLTGDRPCAVSARSVCRFGLTRPEHQVALIHLTGGAGAVIEAGWLLPDGARVAPNSVLEVIGTTAIARIIDDGPLTLVTDGGDSTVTTGDQAAWDPMALLRAQCDHVLAHIALGTPSDRINPESATVALRTMLAATDSARRGGERVDIEW